MARGERWRGPPRTDLERFMRLVGATTVAVANATGLSQTTISRHRAGVATEPKAATYNVILRWADEEARRQGISASKRLSWRPEDEAA